MSGFLDGRSKKHGYFYIKKVTAELRSQALFFSATLQVQTNSPQTRQLRTWMRQLGKRGNPEIVVTGDSSSSSASSSQQTVETEKPASLPRSLSIRSVHFAGTHEKEAFLYAFSRQYRGRTLVFFNSISSFFLPFSPF